MTIRVLLFAAAKQLAGRPEILIDLDEGATVADLRAALASAEPALGKLLPSVRIPLGTDYAADSDPIPPGSEAAIIPPVSGGAPDISLAIAFEFP